MRVVLDTNILVSMALAQGGRFETIWSAWTAGRFHILSAAPLLDEVEAVLQRPTLASILDVATREALLPDLATLTVTAELDEPWPDFRDPKDRFLLALARDGRAGVLVTGDGALLDLARWSETVIVTPADFAQALQ